MKVYVYPADIYGCGYLRLIWASRVLASQGHDVTVVMPEGYVDEHGRKAPANGLKIKTDPSGRAVAITIPKDADVMVMQRITHHALAGAIPLWRSRGIAVVIDMDDDLSTIHPSNPAWRALHPTMGKPGFSWKIAEEACQAATFVTVSTPALLQRYAPHGRGAVLYNHIPSDYLDIPRVDSEVIGWGGTVLSHPDDLQMVGSSLSRMTDAGHALRIVGPGDGVESAVRVRQNWSASGGVDIFQWPHQLTSDIGIGIAPLADTRFNSAKSWLKPLEYASLGIPCVMSSRTEYLRLHRLGVGILARKPRDWEARLRELVASAALREEYSLRGRAVASEWTIEANAWKWLEIWNQARLIEQGALARAS